MRVLDYSAGFPGAENIRAAGYGGAIRYIGFPDRRKCATAAELTDYTRHGLGMALVYEDNADDWRGGHTQGLDAGRRARQHATGIGFPSNRPIYMAVDRDVVTEAEMRTMIEYLRGASVTLGGLQLTGVYGEHDVTTRARSAGVAAWFWQCRAWSGTPIKYDPERHLFQNVGTVTVGGIACDTNEVVRPDWGQHNYERVPALTPDQDFMIRQAYIQITGDTDWTGPDAWGWPTLDGESRSLTAVDFVREIHRELALRLDLTGRPGPDRDTLYGHVLSMRAELHALRASLATLIAAVTALSPDALAAIVRDAVRQHVDITGDIHIGPKQENTS